MKRIVLKLLVASAALIWLDDGCIAQCHAGEGVKLTFIGTGHGRVTASRANSCTLVQGGGKTYVVDVCDGAAGRIMKSGTHITDIDAVFITHDHLDHCWGLPFLIQQITSWNEKKEPFHSRNKDKRYDVFLPSELLACGLDVICKASHIQENPNVALKRFKEGVIFDDGNLTVTAIGNDHSVRDRNGEFTSYSFLFEFVSGEKIYFSGDLGRHFDLSVDTINSAGGVDLLVCELVHFDTALAYDKLNGLKAERICFTHYDDQWEGEGAAELFNEFSSHFRTPAELVTDDDVRIVRKR